MRYRVARQVAIVAVLSFVVSPLVKAAECGPTRYDCAAYYVAHHDLPAAIQELQAQLQQSPQNLKALNLLGIALTESGQIEQANRKFRAALAIDPRFYPARKNLGVNEFNLNHWQGAAADLKQALRSAPTDPITHLYLAEISFQKSYFASALRQYEMAGNRIMTNPDWTLHYAQCLAAKGERAR